MHFSKDKGHGGETGNSLFLEALDYDHVQCDSLHPRFILSWIGIRSCAFGSYLCPLKYFVGSTGSLSDSSKR